MDGRAVQVAQHNAFDPLTGHRAPSLRTVTRRAATSCSRPWIRYDPGLRHQLEMSVGSEVLLTIVRAQQAMLALAR